MRTKYFIIFVMGIFLIALPLMPANLLAGGKTIKIDKKGPIRLGTNDDKDSYKEGEVIIKFKTGIRYFEAISIANSLDVEVERHFKTLSASKNRNYILFRSKSLSTNDLIKTFRNNPYVDVVSPNYRHEIMATTPNDTDFDELWGLNNTGQTGGTSDADIDAPEAWDIQTGSTSVVVADIDTGVDYNHGDLAANMWTNPGEIAGNSIDDDGNGYVDDIYGIDPANGDTDPMDDNGHGTHTSGTIAGVGNNSYGISGVSWNSKIMALKFIDSSGHGYDSDAITCIEYVIDMKSEGVNVVAINASWGGGGYNQSLYDAIELAGTNGIIFCAAAGNDSSDNDSDPHYPSNYRLSNIISVAATDHDDLRSSFSNWGQYSVDLAAPGSNILSTLPQEDGCTGNGVWSDDMESGSTNWSNDSPWALTEEQSNSATYAWSDSPYSNYDNNVDISLTSNSIDLSASSEACLSFWAWLDIEYYWDALEIYTSGNNGSTWTYLGYLDDHTLEWNKYFYCIPGDHLTANFRVKFRFVSDFIITYDGCYIDDVEITDECGKVDAFGSYNGTSMATPHVAGAVALLASQFSSADPLSWKARIMNSADAISSMDGLVVTDGRLNVNNALTIDDLPSIFDIDPFSGRPGDTVTINGYGFGATRGSSYVSFQAPGDSTKTVSTYNSWSDTAIECVVPRGITSGDVTVTRAGVGTSNGLPFIYSAWISKTDIPVSKMDTAVVSYNGNLYLTGYGADPKDTYKYDPATDTYTQLADQPDPPIKYPVDVSLGFDSGGNPNIYLIPDTASGSNTNMLRYDINGNAWYTVSLSGGFTARWSPEMVYDSANNLIYISGGATVPGGGDLNELWSYNPATNTFTQLASFTTARDFHASWLYNGKIYIAGGVDNYGNGLSSTQVYDIASNTWNTENADLGSLPGTWWGTGDALHNDRLWMAGGIYDGNLTKKTGYFDMRSGGTWVEKEDLVYAVYRLEGALCTKVHMLGGDTGGFSYQPYNQVYYGDDVVNLTPVYLLLLGN